MRSFPPDVVVLDTDSLLHARFARGKRAPRIVQAKSYRLAAGTFAPGVVTPQLANEGALAETLRRLRNETGRWDRVSLLLPDSWFRINVIELPSFNEHRGDPLEVIRWSLQRTLPIPPEELRIAWEILSRSATAVRVLVVSALTVTVEALEKAFAAQGIDVALLEPVGINLWNAVAVRENGNGTNAGDRLFVYVGREEFTTGVFRGSQPLFLRSRNLSHERSLQQEIRLSSSYIRDSLRTESFAQCYVAGNGGAEAAAAIAAEFASPVRLVKLGDFVQDAPENTAGYEAELAACAGVFAG